MNKQKKKSLKPEDEDLFGRCNICGALLDGDGHCTHESDSLQVEEDTAEEELPRSPVCSDVG